jgi:hypothetical protein
MKRHVDKIRGLVGEDAVLIACRFRTKKSQGGWRNFTSLDMHDPGYLDKLYSAGNLAVILGAVSNNLISIDFDNDLALLDFQEANSDISNTLTTKGVRGANLWFRMDGDYPSLFKIKRHDAEIGEFRSEGGYTMIHGEHPDGVEYSVVKRVPVVTVRYEDILWPVGYDCYADGCVTERTERTERTEEYRRESWGGGGVLTGDQFDPNSILTDYVPTAPRTNHKNLFGIARRVRAIEMKCERRAEMGELLDVFDAWYNKSTPFLRSGQSKEEYLGEFLDGYERVTHPEMDDILETAMERLNSQPLPAEAENPRCETPEFRRLIGLCYHLSELSVNGVFFLSCRSAQQLLDISNHVKAARWLRTLVGCGILRIHQEGDTTKGRATRYTYVSSTY